jgi:hypothetical protein
MRAGTEVGISVKYFITKYLASEGLLTTRWNGVIISGLLETHKRSFAKPEFKLYYGGGFHVARWNGKHRHPWLPENGTARTIAGLDGIAGVEYTLSSVPLNLAIDWKPCINFSDYKWLWLDNVALSIRYTFK